MDVTSSNSKKALETPFEPKQEVSYIVTKGNNSAPIAMTEKEYADYEKTQNQIQTMVEKYNPAPTEAVKSYYVTKEPLVKFEEKTAKFAKDLIDFGIFPLANVESSITGKKASETISGRVAKTAVETPIRITSYNVCYTKLLRFWSRSVRVSSVL